MQRGYSNAAVAGLPPPPDLDGNDLSPLLADPGGAAIAHAAFSEYPRCCHNLSCHKVLSDLLALLARGAIFLLMLCEA